jgi:hypothetical protein
MLGHLRRERAVNVVLNAVDDRALGWSAAHLVAVVMGVPWASQVVVVLHDGEVVRLPLAASERGPVERWQQETHA